MAPRLRQFFVRLGVQGVPSRLEGSALYVLAARGTHRLRTGEAQVRSRGAEWTEPLVLTLTIYEAPDGTLEEKCVALTLVEAAGRGNEERLGTYSLDMANFREGPPASVMLQTEDMYAADAPQLKVDVEVGISREKPDSTLPGEARPPLEVRPPLAPPVQSVDKLSSNAERLTLSLGFQKVGGSPNKPSPPRVGSDAPNSDGSPESSGNESDSSESMLTVSDISGFTDSEDEESMDLGEMEQDFSPGRPPSELPEIRECPTEGPATAVLSNLPQRSDTLGGTGKDQHDKLMNPQQEAQAGGSLEDTYGDLISSSEDEEDCFEQTCSSSPSPSRTSSTDYKIGEDKELIEEFGSPRSERREPLGTSGEILAPIPRDTANEPRHLEERGREEGDIVAEFDSPPSTLPREQEVNGYEGLRAADLAKGGSIDVNLARVSVLEATVTALENERSDLQGRIQGLEEQALRDQELHSQAEAAIEEESLRLSKKLSGVNHHSLNALTEIGRSLESVLEASKSSGEVATQMAENLSERLGVAIEVSAKLESEVENGKSLLSDKRLLLCEVERLESKVQTLQAEAVDSEVELVDLRQAAPKAKAEIEMLQEQVAQLERELEARFEESRTVNAKLGEVHGVYDALVQQLDATQAEQEELHEIVEVLKEELEGKEVLQVSLEASQSECDSLRGALQALQGELAASRDVRDVREEEVSGQTQNLREEAQTLREQLVRLAASVSDAQAARDRSDTEVAKKSDKIQALQDSLDEESEKRASSERRGASLLAELEALRISEAAMRGALEDKESAKDLEKALLQCVELRNDVEARESQVSALEGDLEELKLHLQDAPSLEHVKQVEAQLQEMSSQKDELQQELIKARESVRAGKRASELESELEILRISESAMREALEADGDKRVEMANRIEALEAELQGVATKATEDRDQAEEMQKKLNVALEKGTLAEKAMQEAEENLRHANIEVAALKDELEQARRSCSDSASAQDLSQGEVSRLTSARDALLVKQQSLESELSELRKDAAGQSESLRGELEISREEVQRLTEQLRNSHAEIQSRRSESSEARLAEVEANLAKEREENERITRKMEDKAKEAASMLDVLKISEESMREEVSQRAEVIKTLEAALEKSGQKISEMANRTADLEVLLGDLEAQSEESRSSETVLRQDLDAKSLELEKVMRELEEEREEATKNRGLLERRKAFVAPQGEMKRIKEDLEIAEGQLKYLRLDFEKKSKELQVAEQRVSENQATADRKVAELESEVELLRVSEAAIREALSDAEKKAADLETCAATQARENDEAARLQTELAETQKSLQQQAGKEHALREELQEAHDVIAVRSQENEGYAKSVLEAREVAQAAEKDAQASQMGMSRLQGELQMAASKASSLEERLTEAERQKVEALASLAKAQTDLESMETEMQDALKGRESADEAENRDRAQVAARCAELESAAAIMRASLEEKTVRARELETELEDATLKLQRQKDSISDEGDTLKASLEELETSRAAEARAKEDLTKAKEELSTLGITVERSALKIAEAVAQVAEMEDQLEQKEVELRTASARLQGEDVLQRHIEELSEKSNAAAPLSKSLEEMKMQLEALEVSNCTMKDSIQDLTAENSSLKSSLEKNAGGAEDAEDLRMQIVVLSGKVADAEARNEELQHAIRCAQFATTPPPNIPAAAPSPMRRFFGGS